MNDSITKEEHVEETKEVKKKTLNLSPKTKLIAGIAFVAVILLLAVLILPKLLNPNAGKVTTISESSLEKVIEINDLSTLDYTYNAITAVHDEESGDLKYHVAYEGTVTAGIDITKVDVSVDDEAKTITVTLPSAEIQSVDVKMGTLDFIFEKDKYETETISQEAYKASLDDLAIKAKEQKDLLDTAKENAIAAMSALIAPWVEQIDETYTVEIK